MDQGSLEEVFGCSVEALFLQQPLAAVPCLCRSRAFPLCVGAWAGTPVTQPPVSLPAHKGLGDVEENNDPCTSIF